MAMAVVGGRWAEQGHIRPWKRALEHLCALNRLEGGDQVWLGLRRYPGTLLLYALGLGAVESDRLSFLGQLFSIGIPYRIGAVLSVVHLLAPSRLVSGGQLKEFLRGEENQRLQLNKWICATLREHSLRDIPDDEKYKINFVKLEILMSLSSSYHSRPDGVGLVRGTFVDQTDSNWAIMQEIDQSIRSLGDGSPYVTADIFGKTAESCKHHFELWQTAIFQRTVL